MVDRGKRIDGLIKTLQGTRDADEQTKQKDG
jgi:hypothetical protein